MLMAGVSCATYVLNWMHCHEKVYHIMNQYDKELIMQEKYNIHFVIIFDTNRTSNSIIIVNNY